MYEVFEPLGFCFEKRRLGFTSSWFTTYQTTWEEDDVRSRLNRKQRPHFFPPLPSLPPEPKRRKCVWICFGSVCGVCFAPVPPVKGSRRPFVRSHAAAMKMGVQTAPGEGWPPSQPGSVLSPTTCKWQPSIYDETQAICTLKTCLIVYCTVFTTWVMAIEHHRVNLVQMEGMSCRGF